MTVGDWDGEEIKHEDDSEDDDDYDDVATASLTTSTMSFWKTLR